MERFKGLFSRQETFKVPTNTSDNTDRSKQRLLDIAIMRSGRYGPVENARTARLIQELIRRR